MLFHKETPQKFNFNFSNDKFWMTHQMFIMKHHKPWTGSSDVEIQQNSTSNFSNDKFQMTH